MDKSRLLELAGVDSELFEVVSFDRMPETEIGLETELDQIINRLEAAKRGLALANKLGDPRHKSAVLGNLNRIRARLHKVVDAVSQQSGGYEDYAY